MSLHVFLSRHLFLQGHNHGEYLCKNFLRQTIVIRNVKIVWKHGLNQPFYAFILQTKLYYNPFFSTMHQNVKKPKSRAARAVYGPTFSPFYVIIIPFFSFFCQNANITGLNSAVIGCNLSKKHKLVLSQT